MSLNKLKLEAIDNTLSNLIPKEGETINIHGGIGNKIIYQCKKEEGLFYQRRNEDEEWEQFDLMGIHSKALQDMTNCLYHDFDRRDKAGFIFKLKSFIKNIFK